VRSVWVAWQTPAGTASASASDPLVPPMRALVALPGGRLSWRSVPTPPPPGPAGAVVRPIAIATCDMDPLIALGASPFPLPLQLGHEWVAEVLAVG
jgi:alcohol dehydrogenase